MYVWNIGFLLNINDGNNRNPLAQYRQNTATQSRGSHLATLEYEAVNANVVYRVYKFEITSSQCSPAFLSTSFL